jgi:Putative prokaryotic signal transducing protein
MFCPICEAEYEPGKTRCPDDDADLVEHLDPKSTARDGSEARFMVLHRFGNPTEAEMVQDMLNQNGIRSIVRSGGADTLSPLLSSTALGAAVLVDERDYDKAQELYQAFFGEDTTPLTGAGDEFDEEE